MPKGSKLNEMVIRQTAAPSAGERLIHDDKKPGLSLRITSNDVRTWSVRYYTKAGRRRRYTIGKFRFKDETTDGYTIGQARDKAQEVIDAARAGRDPEEQKIEVRAAGTLTFETLAEKWLAEARTVKRSRQGLPWKPKTRAEYERLVRAEILPVLGKVEPEAVTRKQIRQLYLNIEKRAKRVAQNTLVVLRSIYSWAAENDHVESVPAFPKYSTQSRRRSRFLDEAEIRAFLRACDQAVREDAQEDDEPIGPLAEAFRLELITAQRRGSVLAMRWQDIKVEDKAVWWVIPSEFMKGGEEGGESHRVPLTEPALEVLRRLRAKLSDEVWVFPSPKGLVTRPGRERRGTVNPQRPYITNPQKAAGRLWEKLGLKGSATLHDLRRTAITSMVDLGVSKEDRKKILAHADGGDAEAHYDAHKYDREKRVALEKWAAELERIAAGKKGKRAAKVLPWAG